MSSVNFSFDIDYLMWLYNIIIYRVVALIYSIHFNWLIMILKYTSIYMPIKKYIYINLILSICNNLGIRKNNYCNSFKSIKICSSFSHRLAHVYKYNVFFHFVRFILFLFFNVPFRVDEKSTILFINE